MALIALLAVAVAVLALGYFAPRADDTLTEALMDADHRIQHEVRVARDRQEWAA